MNVSIASSLAQISIASSRACRRSSVGAFGSPSSNIRSAARPKEPVHLSCDRVREAFVGNFRALA